MKTSSCQHLEHTRTQCYVLMIAEWLLGTTRLEKCLGSHILEPTNIKRGCKIVYRYTVIALAYIPSMYMYFQLFQAGSHYTTSVSLTVAELRVKYTLLLAFPLNSMPQPILSLTVHLWSGIVVELFSPQQKLKIKLNTCVRKQLYSPAKAKF